MSQIGKFGISEFFEKRIGRSKMVLLRYGPGSGGELLIKGFVTTCPPGVNGVLISSIESEEELRKLRTDSTNLMIVSVFDSVEAESEMMRKKDRFVTEGVLVTDLLEISMTDRTSIARPSSEMLTAFTSAATKQVLPFRYALDSLPDFMGERGIGSILPRLSLIRRTVRSVQGSALIGTPIGWNGLSPMETNVFDCILEATSRRTESGFERRLTLVHLRNDPSPPEEWSLDFKTR